MAAFALFRIYLAKNDTATKCKALKAMGGIFSSRPRVMLEMQQRGMIKELMSTNSDPELQLETLICWKEILEAEENRVDSGEAKRQIESKKCITLSEKISGDQDSDASLLGSCCIQNSSRLLSMTSSPIKNIRMHSLLLLEILLRQGLISPMDTVRF
jgi:cohesin loading factor subunit SCC2